MQHIPPDTAAWFVDFQDVWLAYNDELLEQSHFAVEAIELKVRQSEFIAIVEPSGCGKSTFMKLATGLKMPSKGKIMIDGQPVSGPLKISGMSFQAPSLLPWRTTVDNVLLPLEIVEPFRSNFKAKRTQYLERAQTTAKSRAVWVRRQVSLAALRRHAAACQHLPRTHPRAQNATSGRTLWRTRCFHP
jgi:NitT/TauT family transport system ATP-binding protein